MRFVIFTHSLVSDWNHGNAHFLRGIASELLNRGHQLNIFEPEAGWSRQNLLREHGQAAIDEFHRFFPHLHSTLYDEDSLDLNEVTRNADVVLVHEWNSPALINRLARHRSTHDYQLYFHDTHHRIVSDPDSISEYNLRAYDGVMAYGQIICDAYLQQGLARNAVAWHEAADHRVFKPIAASEQSGDLVWIGNWGDGERVQSLREFLIEPVRRLRLQAIVYGVRYPREALDELASAGISYGGWLPNYRAPEVFSQYKVTVHVPRRPYVETLSGIPTIRPFEALACGIPLISAPWNDTEHLFNPGADFLIAQNGDQMTSLLSNLLEDVEMRRRLAGHGLKTILERHTCAHRVDELLSFVAAPIKATVARERN